MMGIQYFQNIEYDSDGDDNTQDIQNIHDDVDNDTDIKVDTKLNVNYTDNKYMEDDNDDLNIPMIVD
ncbi:unnamed protein product [Rhizophagus irregularis]|nr:unnamed protein product [Rhizophagus irregularis]